VWGGGSHLRVILGASQGIEPWFPLSRRGAFPLDELLHIGAGKEFRNPAHGLEDHCSASELYLQLVTKGTI
jgi:hypothetical protein